MVNTSMKRMIFLERVCTFGPSHSPGVSLVWLAPGFLWETCSPPRCSRGRCICASLTWAEQTWSGWVDAPCICKRPSLEPGPLSRPTETAGLASTWNTSSGSAPAGVSCRGRLTLPPYGICFQPFSWCYFSIPVTGPVAFSYSVVKMQTIWPFWFDSWVISSRLRVLSNSFNDWRTNIRISTFFPYVSQLPKNENHA